MNNVVLFDPYHKHALQSPAHLSRHSTPLRKSFHVIDRRSTTDPSALRLLHLDGEKERREVSVGCELGGPRRDSEEGGPMRLIGAPWTVTNSHVRIGYKGLEEARHWHSSPRGHAQQALNFPALFSLLTPHTSLLT